MVFVVPKSTAMESLDSNSSQFSLAGGEFVNLPKATYPTGWDSADLILRVNAVRAFAELRGPFVVEGLIDALRDPSPRVKVIALKALHHYDDDRIVPAVLDLCASPDEEESSEAKALLRLPDEPANLDAERLGALLRSGDRLTRLAAAHVAIRWNVMSPELMESILFSEETPEALRSVALVRIANNISRASAVALLSAAMRPPRERRMKALYALRQMPKHVRVSELTALVSDEDVGIAREAIETIGRVGGTEATTVIDRAQVSKEPVIRLAAFNALGSFDRPRYVRAIATAIRDTSEIVRLGVVEALSSAAPPGAFLAVTPLLSDPVMNVRLATVAAFTRSGQVDALGLLAETTRSPDPITARAAESFVRGLGGPDGIARAVLTNAVTSPFDRARALLRLHGIMGFNSVQFLKERERQLPDSEPVKDTLAAISEMRSLLRATGAADIAKAEQDILLRTPVGETVDESSLLRPLPEWMRTDEELAKDSGGGRGFLDKLFGD